MDFVPALFSICLNYLCCLYLMAVLFILILYIICFSAVLSNISQSPELVKVPLGGTAYLQCDLGHLMTVCDVISWYKLHPRTQQLNKTTAINTETLEEGQCLGVFHNITVRDSGIYYCVVVYTVMMYMGNGSRVIVTGNFIYVAENTNCAVLYVCLLSLGLNAAFVIIVVTVVIAVRTCLGKI
uniref:Ig-like domain-containing protein n=1 Tax=Astyanax mexicanus TaxID=7994 RepID=A0A8B9K5C7_ASTMX